MIYKQCLKVENTWITEEKKIGSTFGGGWSGVNCIAIAIINRLLNIQLAICALEHYAISHCIKSNV